MAELSTLPEQTRQQIEQIRTVDLVVGLAAEEANQNLAGIAETVRGGLARLTKPVRAVLLHKDAGSPAAPAPSQNGLENESLQLLSYSPPALHSSLMLVESIAGAYRSICEISQKLDARACVVIASSPEGLTSEWIFGLAQPVLEGELDLVAPSYAPHKFEGLLNNAILYPATRALYGKRVLNPLGPDFGFSSRLVQALLSESSRARGPGVRLPLIAPEAIVRGFKLCQAHLGRRIFPPVDWKNLDSILAEVLDPLFLGIERDAAFWQHIRSSEPVPTYGDALPWVEESIAFDAKRLLEPFKLGFRNLREIWGLVLPPSALLELTKADRLPPEQFRIPDELWTNIIYDFALAYHLRTIGRDHLLHALTPLYLGWIASYAIEVEPLGGVAVQRRLERLCTAYESRKPYLVSRWRWPDRFNP
ncbi:MAG TPA: hypothetical protein VH601_07780 [Bryobacteraceae bacterium]|jgi:hypothetical protein